MKMAKASDADIQMAMDLSGALEVLTTWDPVVPTAVKKVANSEDSEPFDCDDREQCVRVLGHLLDLSNRASLARVVWGYAVMLDPRNKCLDPNADNIEHHPEAKAGIAAAQARSLDEWHEDVGPVLWWQFPVCEAPWVGRPIDGDWPGCHTHWTPLIVPSQPPVTTAQATEPEPQTIRLL